MIDPTEEDYIVEAEQFGDEEEEEKRGCFRTVALIVIILLLLLLFWPVKPEKKSQPRAGTKEEAPVITGDGIVGDAKYVILKTETVHQVNNRRFSNYKGTAVGVEFTVQNLAPKPRSLDFSMVEIKDQFGNQHPATFRITDLWYAEKGLKSPWGETVGAGATAKAVALFFVYPAPPKKFSLLAKDFDWRIDEFISLDLGTIDALPKK